MVPLGSPTSVTGIGMKLRVLRSITMSPNSNVRVSTKVDAETGAGAVAGAGAGGGPAAGGVAGAGEGSRLMLGSGIMVVV